MNNIKQKPEINPDNSSFGAVELKANLNPEQREYLEILKAKMKKILGNKTKQELAKAGDLVSLKNYKQILMEALEFLQTREMKNLDQELVFTKPEGKKVRIDIPEELEHWTEFYEKAGIDWVKLPEKIELSPDNIRDLQKAGEFLCAHSKQYEKLRLIIVPEGLADNSNKYFTLFNKMARPCVDQQHNIYSHVIDKKFDYMLFDMAKNQNNYLRLILVRDWQFSEPEDEDAKPITNQVVTVLEQPAGFFEKTGMRGLDLATYLVWQWDHFQRTEKVLDFDSKIILLPGTKYDNGHYRPAVFSRDTASSKNFQIIYSAFHPFVGVEGTSICPIGKEIEIAN